MVTPRHDRNETDSDSDSRPTLDLRRPLWFADAACRGSTLDFTEEANKTSRDASLQVCGFCPAMLPCRAYALDDKSLVGIWGGTTSAARRAMRKAREAPAGDEFPT
jgi:hypothetical protein